MDELRWLLGFEWARALPMYVARASVVAFSVLVLWLVLAQPRARVYDGAPDRARWRDLRLWAAGVMVLQMGLYLWI